NSCAVGDKFRLLEIRFGMLAQNFDDTPWFDWYKQQVNNPLVESYFGNPKAKNSNIQECFFNTKSFNELTRKLAIKFNQRRSGNATPNRPYRRYPIHLETHPYLVRDTNDRTSAIDTVEGLPSEPKFSEPIARKYLMGQVTKRDDTNKNWYQKLGLTWKPGYVDSWVTKFEDFLKNNPELNSDYDSKPDRRNGDKITQTRNLEEIANSSSYFLSMIYADGNNMGGYIQKIKTPEAYRQFSEDILEATEKSVYYALAKNLHPHQLKNLRKPDNPKRENAWVHPFEIIAIGGDDVMIMVPANKSLAIAKDIGEKFEDILAAKGRYNIDKSTQPNKPGNIHRYLPADATHYDSRLSTSMGVLTIKYDTPIYYANNLVSQLLKSAKEKAKKLKKDQEYYGGTVDILTLKSVTMISSDIKKFRENGLVVNTQPKLQLYAAPYTLHEVGGLIKTIQAFKKVDFPRSQLYQIRSLLERGKRTAILNYRYFCVRLKSDNRRLIQDDFEKAWCFPKDETNNGNLAPWMSIVDDKTTIYETLWREIIDLYPFIEIDNQSESEKPQETEVSKS
ncbi:MAG: type III-B CRISPR-associated protein Cas10/Cmr2, partial [Arthrospira sp. SH-MAG29]